jgi:cytochrome c-type biogenesis protein CcmE
MTPARKKRLFLISLMVAGVGVGVYFALKALDENIMFFFTPTEVTQGKAPNNKLFRMGGMVVEGSVSRPGDGLTVQFDLTDNDKFVRGRA